MPDARRYLIGDYLPHKAFFILDGDVRAADAQAAVLAWLASTGPHRQYETALASDDEYEAAAADLEEQGFRWLRTVHEIPDDLDAPPARARTDAQLDAGDACLRARPFVVVGSRETGASIRANRVLVGEDSLEALVGNAYALSAPQGLGFLHAREGALDDETVQEILSCDGGGFVRLSMDYVHGRAVKLHVYRDEDRGAMFIDADRARPWPDHGRAAFAELLRRSLTAADRERNAAYLADLFGEGVDG